MSDELEVTVSGEGDFTMTTENAWRIEIRNGRTNITVTIEGSDPRVEVLGQPIRIEHFPVEKDPWPR